MYMYRYMYMIPTLKLSKPNLNFQKVPLDDRRTVVVAPWVFPQHSQPETRVNQ